MKKESTPWTIRDLRDFYPAIEFPEYQREPNLWTRAEKQRLIDSIARGFDIASLYLYIHKDGTIDCVDGRQRIGAIIEFYGDDGKGHGGNLRFQHSNEIYTDNNLDFSSLEGKTYREIVARRDEESDQLSARFIERFLDHEITVVLLSDSSAPEEFNLQFTRLNLGTIINSGEKLNAMVGDLRNVCFNRLGKHSFLSSTKIPTRRFAQENVAAQIMAQVISLDASGEFTRVRHMDLQRDFKRFGKFSETQLELADALENLLDLLAPAFASRNVLRNRAITVSVVLLAWQLAIDTEEKANKFAKFIEEFAFRLVWQVKKGLEIDPVYHYLSDFQRSITQASAEKSAIESRIEILRREMDNWYSLGTLSGDLDWKNRHPGLDPGEESRK